MTKGFHNRGHEPLPNDELWIAIFNLCEQQGRRWPEIQQACAELTEATTSEDVAAILLPLLAYDPSVEVVSAAAVKDARESIRTARMVLERIDNRLDATIEKAVGKDRTEKAKRTRTTKYVPCPACGEDKAAQGLPNHLRGTHGWTNDDIARWKETKDAVERIDRTSESRRPTEEQLPEEPEGARAEQAGATAA